MNTNTRSTRVTPQHPHLTAEVSPIAPARVHRPRVAKQPWAVKGAPFDPARVSKTLSPTR